MQQLQDQLKFLIDTPSDQELIKMFSEFQQESTEVSTDFTTPARKANKQTKAKRKAQRKARAKQRGFVTPGFLIFCMLIAFVLLMFTIGYYA